MKLPQSEHIDTDMTVKKGNFLLITIHIFYYLWWRWKHCIGGWRWQEAQGGRTTLLFKVLNGMLGRRTTSRGYWVSHVQVTRVFCLAEMVSPGRLFRLVWVHRVQLWGSTKLSSITYSWGFFCFFLSPTAINLTFVHGTRKDFYFFNDLLPFVWCKWLNFWIYQKVAWLKVSCQKS